MTDIPLIKLALGKPTTIFIINQQDVNIDSLIYTINALL